MIKYLGTKIVEAEYYEQCRFGHDEHGNVLLRPAGYIVKYPDGYESWSPKKVFEEAYRPINGLTFGLALEAVKKGKGMRLPQWSQDVVIRAQFPDENSKMTAPYLYVESRFGRVPWKETMIELFAENWEIVD